MVSAINPAMTRTSTLIFDLHQFRLDSVSELASSSQGRT